jgi:hypothetical protein
VNNRNLEYDRAVDYETWRPALSAFYRAEAWFQSAENVKNGFALTIEDKRTIDALVAAFELRAA